MNKNHMSKVIDSVNMFNDWFASLKTQPYDPRIAEIVMAIYDNYGLDGMVLMKSIHTAYNARCFNMCIFPVKEMIESRALECSNMSEAREYITAMGVTFPHVKLMPEPNGGVGLAMSYEGTLQLAGYQPRLKALFDYYFQCLAMAM